jgi:hypothetical protein
VLAARSRLGERPPDSGRRFWELQGLVFCPCGRRLTRLTVSRKNDGHDFYYVCSRHRNEDRCEYARNHRAEEIEERVRQITLTMSQRPGALMQEIERSIEVERARLENAEREIAGWRVELQKLRDQRTRARWQHQEGYATDEELKADLDRIAARMKEAEHYLARLEGAEEEIKRLEELPSLIGGFIRDLPFLIHGRPAERGQRYREFYEKMLNLRVVAHKDGTLELSGTFGAAVVGRGEEPLALWKAVTYDFSDVPSPDDPVWEVSLATA